MPRQTQEKNKKNSIKKINTDSKSEEEKQRDINSDKEFEKLKY
jgi:hypothetical protein